MTLLTYITLIYLMLTYITFWLVVSTILKNIRQWGSDDIPYMRWNIKFHGLKPPSSLFVEVQQWVDYGGTAGTSGSLGVSFPSKYCYKKRWKTIIFHGFTGKTII